VERGSGGNQVRGRARAFPIGRRIVADLMHFAAGLPSVPAQRRMSLAPTVEARMANAIRPPWSAIFTKAFGIVAQEYPELRRVYLKYPCPHLYEYPASIAAVAIERRCGDENTVLGCMIMDPANMPLREISGKIIHAASSPIEQVGEFRRALRNAALPLPIRRSLWWIMFNFGRQRSRYVGTFAVSAVASLGTELIHPRSAWTAFLTYGAFATDGSIDVRLIFDHRVLDGGTVARILAHLEEVLNGPMVEALRSLAPSEVCRL